MGSLFQLFILNTGAPLKITDGWEKAEGRDGWILGAIPTTFSSVHTVGGISSSITIDVLYGYPQ